MNKRHSSFLWIVLLVGILVVGIWCGTNLLPEKNIDTPATPTTLEAPPEPTEPPAPEIPVWAENLPEWELTATQYFVYNTKTNSFEICSSDLDTKIYPASITKLMTSLVAVDYLKPTDVITAGVEVQLIDPDSSVAGIRKGDTLTFSQLLEGMLLPSGNDAAYVVATAVGREILQQPYASVEDAIAAFIQAMNQKAQALGLTGSHFMNPDGIHHENHYLTLRDLALLGKFALQNQQIRECVALVEGHNPRFDETDSSDGAVRQWKNTNALIDPASEYYCPEAIGLKTGYTGAAGSCLLSAFSYGSNTYIVGVFNCPWGDTKFADTMHLFAENVIF